MLQRLLLGLLVGSTILTAEAAVDLTPTVSDHVEEGIPYKILTFKQPNGSITFIPPARWAFRGSSDRLVLTPPEKSFAEGVIQAVSPAAAQAFDEPRVRALEQQVLGGLPPGSQLLEVLSRDQNPVQLNGNQSFGLLVAYDALGRKFHRNVIFVNTPETQYVFRFTAEKAEFDALNAVFRRAVISWRWISALPPK